MSGCADRKKIEYLNDRGGCAQVPALADVQGATDAQKDDREDDKHEMLELDDESFAMVSLPVIWNL